MNYNTEHTETNPNLIMLVDFCKKTLATACGNSYQEYTLYKENDKYRIDVFSQDFSGDEEHSYLYVSEKAVANAFEYIKNNHLAESQKKQSFAFCGGDFVVKFRNEDDKVTTFSTANTPHDKIKLLIGMGELLKDEFDKAKTASKTNTIFVNDFSTDYCVFGKGEKTFVIIPGLSLKNLTPFESAIEGAFNMFTEDYTVYLFDRRNEVPETYSIEDMADDTIKVFNGLGISDACIFGASQGGMIAETIAIKAPTLVSKLVLGSTCAKTTDMLFSRISNFINLAKQGDMNQLCIYINKSLFSKNTLDAVPSLLEDSSVECSPAEINRFISIASALLDFDMLDKIHNIACPTLVIGCEGDIVMSKEASYEIKSNMSCELYMYGNEYGHAVYDEAPDYKNRILEFINK